VLKAEKEDTVMKKEEAPKPMTKKKYMDKFSRSARWRLGAAEAEEAIRDYREMVYQEGRDEAKLVEELGDPVQAAWLLTDAKEYKRWIKMFVILAFGLFLMAVWAWTGMVFPRFARYSESWYPVWMMAVGLALSLVWFRRHGQKSGPLSKRLLLALAVVLAFGVATMTWTVHVLDADVMARLVAAGAGPTAWQVVLFRELVINGGTFCPVIALVGLVLARCRDRRWLALYTLALTVAALCIIEELWTHHIGIFDAGMIDVRLYVFPRLVPVGLAGLIGTGVALCLKRNCWSCACSSCSPRGTSTATRCSHPSGRPSRRPRRAPSTPCSVGWGRRASPPGTWPPAAGGRTGNTTNSPRRARNGWTACGGTGGTCGTPSRPLGWSDRFILTELRGLPKGPV